MGKMKKICVAVACCVFGVASIGHAGDGVDHKKKIIHLAGSDAATGKYGNLGVADRDGQEIAIQEINSTGGIKTGPLKGYKLKLDFFDDRGDAREAASVAKKIAAGDYLAVMGQSFSSSALAAAPVFHRYKIGNVIPYANAASITEQGFNNIARLPFTTKNVADATAKSITKEMGKKAAAVIYDSTDYGQQLSNTFKGAEGKYKFKTVSSSAITAGQDVDFTSVLTKAKSTNPDVLVIFGTYNEGGLIARQVREMGWNIPVVSTDGVVDPKFFELAGNVNNIKLVMSAELNMSSPQAKYLTAQYKKRTGHNSPGSATIFGYDSVQVAKTIIENGGATRDKFIKGIRNVKVNTGIFASTYSFDQKGDSMLHNFVLLPADEVQKKMK